MPFAVTRQRQFPDGTPVVEVSRGGRDYTNPDALAAKYPGEFETYDDPRQAVETAIAICRAWRRDGEKKARVGVGATGGFTMPFDTCTFAEARSWGKKAYESLPKCARCGAVLGQAPFIRTYGDNGDMFCSEFCAEKGIGD